MRHIPQTVSVQSPAPSPIGMASACINDFVAAEAAGATDAPTGYKRTEAGVIPEDWNVQRMGELASILRGASPRPIDDPKWFDEESPTGWLRIADVTTTLKYLDATSQNLSLAGVSNSRFVSSGGLVMSICATVGRPIITRKDVCIHDGFVVFNNPHADKEYLYYVLSNLEPGWSKRGQTGSQMNLNTGLINSTPIALPPPTEQRAIAEALSDMDGLLESLDALIAKKRTIMKATMEQLLTGKTRLPVSSGKWTVANFDRDSVLKARIGWHGLTTAEYLSSGKYHLVTGTDFEDGQIEWGRCCYVTRSRYLQDKHIQLRLGDVLLTKDGTIGKVGYVAHLPGPATLNSGVFVIRPANKKWSPLYMFYVLTSRIFRDFLERLAAGSTISHLYQKDFVDFEFSAPERDEQVTIAAILSDMDSEITKLEQRREKTRAI